MALFVLCNLILNPYEAKGELELRGNLILPLIHLTAFSTNGRSCFTARERVAGFGILKNSAKMFIICL